MTWQEVARTDIEEGVRSRPLWAVVALFVVVMLLVGRFASRGSLLTGAALLDTNARTFAFLLTVLFVPVAGLVVGHGALTRVRNRVAHAPETGDGDGATPRELFVGTVVGRTVVLSVALLVGFLPAFVAWVAQSGTASLYELLVAFLVAVALGLLFVAIAVAISTLTRSRRWAATGAVGALVGLYAWPFVPELLGIGVPHALLERFWLVFIVGDVSTTLFSLRQGEVTSSVLGVVVLGVLVAVPLALGYVRFDPN